MFLTEQARVGHFIVEIFDDSPAEAASLKEGDILIEVNGVNIENETLPNFQLNVKVIHISIKTTYLHVLYMSCVFTLCF
jgi:C-terminal processing protease CtpA/Prc